MAERPKGYGMTAELHDKVRIKIAARSFVRGKTTGVYVCTQKAAKHDPQLEDQARRWIEAVTGETLDGTFHEALKDGKVLCKLINILQSGSVPKINDSKMAFKMVSNRCWLVTQSVRVIVKLPAKSCTLAVTGKFSIIPADGKHRNVFDTM